MSSGRVNGSSEFVLDSRTARPCCGKVVILKGSGVCGVDLDAEKGFGFPAEDPVSTIVVELRGESGVAIGNHTAEAFGLDLQFPLVRRFGGANKGADLLTRWGFNIDALPFTPSALRLERVECFSGCNRWEDIVVAVTGREAELELIVQSIPPLRL